MMESEVIAEPVSQDMSSSETDNQFTWIDTLFYDPSSDGQLDVWLRANLPSTRLNREQIKWLSVVHPESDVDLYKRKWNRLGQTSQEVIDSFQPRLRSVSHEELLTTAVKVNVLKGYWMIFCDDNEELDDWWRFFALGLYTLGDQVKYSRLECCKKKDSGQGGVIFVINDDFTDTATVFGVSFICNQIANKNGLEFSRPFLYKPAFYTDIGMYSDVHAREKPYIFRSHPGDGGISYMGNASEWFKIFF